MLMDLLEIWQSTAKDFGGEGITIFKILTWLKKIIRSLFENAFFLIINKKSKKTRLFNLYGVKSD